MKNKSRVAHEGPEDSRAITQATPAPSQAVSHRAFPHWLISALDTKRVPWGIRGDAVVRAQMRVQELLTPCVVWVKLLSLPVPHLSSNESGPSGVPR